MVVRGGREARVRARRAAAVPAAALLGAALGLGLYTFVYAKGYSYLTNNPQACANSALTWSMVIARGW